MAVDGMDIPFEALLKEEIVTYDCKKYNFVKIIRNIFELNEHEELSQLHWTERGQSEPGYADLSTLMEGNLLNGYDKKLDDATRAGCSSFHKIYRTSPLKNELLRLYESFLREVIAPSIGCKERLIFQKNPVFRVFLPGHLGLGPRHRDDSYHPQPNEVTFWMPFTEVFDSNTLWIESEEGKGDFHPIVARNGQVCRFYSNKCEHYSLFNETNITRVSMDFRVIRGQDFHLSPLLDTSKSNYFSIGRYYDEMEI